MADGELKIGPGNKKAKADFNKADKKFRKASDKLATAAKNLEVKSGETARKAREIEAAAVADSTNAANTQNLLLRLNPPKAQDLDKGVKIKRTTEKKPQQNTAQRKPQSYKEEVKPQEPHSIVEVLTKNELPPPNSATAEYNPKSGLIFSERLVDEGLLNKPNYAKSAHSQQKNLYPNTQVKIPLIKGGQPKNITVIKDTEQNNTQAIVRNYE